MRGTWILIGMLTLIPLALGASGTGRSGATQVRIVGGSYQPLYSDARDSVTVVTPFLIDTRGVTRAEYRAFLAEHPRWQRGRVPGVFADDGYLAGWPAQPGAGEDTLLATEVSWFAARAYCRARDARLPTTAEWEFLARADEHDPDAASDAAFLRRALDLALAPRAGQPATGSGFVNAWGVRGMHGVMNEWVLDFNTAFAGADSRKTTSGDRSLTCAAGATATGDSRDYAAFMRYAFRAAAEARSTSRTLGFRCARDAS